MPEFKNMDDLYKFLQNNPDEVLKHAQEDYITVNCPACGETHKVKNLRNGYGLCENKNQEFKIDLDIQIKT